MATRSLPCAMWGVNVHSDSIWPHGVTKCREFPSGRQWFIKRTQGAYRRNIHENGWAELRARKVTVSRKRPSATKDTQVGTGAHARVGSEVPRSRVGRAVPSHPGRYEPVSIERSPAGGHIRPPDPALSRNCEASPSAGTSQVASPTPTSPVLVGRTGRPDLGRSSPHALEGAPCGSPASFPSPSWAPRSPSRPAVRTTPNRRTRRSPPRPRRRSAVSPNPPSVTRSVTAPSRSPSTTPSVRSPWRRRPNASSRSRPVPPSRSSPSTPETRSRRSTSTPTTPKRPPPRTSAATPPVSRPSASTTPTWSSSPTAPSTASSSSRPWTSPHSCWATPPTWRTSTPRSACSARSPVRRKRPTPKRTGSSPSSTPSSRRPVAPWARPSSPSTTSSTTPCSPSPPPPSSARSTTRSVW